MSITTDKRKLVIEKIRRDFGENLTEMLKSRGKTQSDLADYLGVTRGAVSQWCSGRNTPAGATAQKIADYLGVPLSELAKERGNVEAFSPVVAVPLYESVSAGFGSTREEALGTYGVTVTNKDEANNTLCVIVSGDSMLPDIKNGDILQVRRQTSVDNGDIAVVLVDGLEHYVKKVEYGIDYIRLVSLNSDYKPMVFKGADVQRVYVEGKVIATIRRW